MSDEGVGRDATLGPSVVGGRIIWKLLPETRRDGPYVTSTSDAVSCACIGEPFASRCVEAFRYAVSNASHVAKIEAYRDAMEIMRSFKKDLSKEIAQ